MSLTDSMIPLSAVPTLLPARRAGKKTAPSTVHRWTKAGLRGVKLRYVQCGGVKCVTAQMLEEFFDQLTVLASDRGARTAIKRGNKSGI